MAAPEWRNLKPSAAATILVELPNEEKLNYTPSEDTIEEDHQLTREENVAMNATIGMLINWIRADSETADDAETLGEVVAAPELSSYVRQLLIGDQAARQLFERHTILISEPLRHVLCDVMLPRLLEQYGVEIQRSVLEHALDTVQQYADETQHVGETFLWVLLDLYTDTARVCHSLGLNGCTLETDRAWRLVMYSTFVWFEWYFKDHHAPPSTVDEIDEAVRNGVGADGLVATFASLHLSDHADDEEC